MEEVKINKGGGDRGTRNKLYSRSLFSIHIFTYFYLFSLTFTYYHTSLLSSDISSLTVPSFSFLPLSSISSLILYLFFLHIGSPFSSRYLSSPFSSRYISSPFSSHYMSSSFCTPLLNIISSLFPYSLS